MYLIQTRTKVVQQLEASLAAVISIAQHMAKEFKRTYTIAYQSGAPLAYVNKLGDVSWHKQNDRELQS